MIRLTVAVLFVLINSSFSFGADTDLGKQLIDASRQGNAELVRQLLDDGVDINARGRFDITAVWQAASRGHDELLKLLVEKGADVNVPDSVWHVAPLMMVHDRDLVVLLINHGAKGVEGILNGVALSGDLELVRAIVKARKIDLPSLAQARAHAEIGKHDKIVTLLDQLNDAPLPPLPLVPETTLQSYEGHYLSERLNEVEVVARNGKLILKEEERGERPLVAIDPWSFALGATRFEFEVEDGNVSALVRHDLYSRRRYVPRATVLTNETNGDATSNSAKRDDPQVLARDRWPSFRGIEARGIATEQDLPESWDVEEGRNLQWRTPIAGLGNSCPEEKRCQEPFIEL